MSSNTEIKNEDKNKQMETSAAKDTPLLREEETPLLREEERPLLREEERPLLREEETPLLREEETPLLWEEETPLLREEEIPLTWREETSSRIQGASSLKKEESFKVLVIGDAGTGKTSLIHRYVRNVFRDVPYSATIGADFLMKRINWNANTDVKLKIWDLAGADRFQAMTRTFYRYTDGAVIVFDVTQPNTYDNAFQWKKYMDILHNAPSEDAIPTILVGNKAPEPPESWEGIRNATEDGFGCPLPRANASYPTSEDCLYLNVYTTALPNSKENPNRPVLVFFHSGGWYFNTGLSVRHGPQYLMDKDIVLVVTNYRLAALGFLSTGDDVLIGNYGMKDQVATLRWVQQNIAAFGGNKKEVTIAGCSVGGASVWFHMISPMSRGLFNKGISVSMGLNAKWDITKDPRTQAEKQAGLLNCQNNTSTQIAQCLRTKDAQEIASTFFTLLIWDTNPLLQYSPVIEQDYGQERFLTESPMKSFLDGNFMKVPWMTGVNKNERDQWAYYVLLNETSSNYFYEHFEELAPVTFRYEEGTERSRLASRAFKQFYLHNQPLTNNSMTDLGNLFSDAVVRYGHDLTSKLASKLSGKPVYSYNFVYQGRYSYRYWPGTRKPFGVSHEDDLIYLFYNSITFPEFKPQDPESQMVEKLTTLWANFIYTGNPTPNRSEVLDNVIWERMTTDNLAYLSIDSQLKMKSRLHQDRMELWDKYFPAKA